tara:strand:+ start:183 stop:842 length:660 start_codon:yes stop_codon:yes gene_type:complete
MGKEINLLINYPKTKRNTSERQIEKTKEVVSIAKKFGFDYFDGDRKYGYGGYKYNPKYWSQVSIDLINHYNLNNNSKVLDVGCAKGFLLYELKKHLPDLTIEGIDISDYAVQNAKKEIKKYLKVGNAADLPYADKSYDLVVSIVTLHNLKKDKLKKALAEITRVSRKDSFITLDAYSNNEEKRNMEDWNLTAETMMSKEEWKTFFIESNFHGDYYWFIP